MHHYDPCVVADQATGRPLVGIHVTVIDAETLVPVTTYRNEAPVTLITGVHGLVEEFQTEESTRRVQITAGPVTLHRWCQEIAGAAQDAADRASAAAAEAETAASAAVMSALASAKAYTDEKTTPTELGTQHLDTVDTPGDYMQSENAEAVTSAGYPVPYAGSLEVSANASRRIVIQTYRTYREADNGKSWTRTRYLGNWSAWAQVSGGATIQRDPVTGDYYLED